MPSVLPRTANADGDIEGNGKRYGATHTFADESLNFGAFAWGYLDYQFVVHLQKHA